MVHVVKYSCQYAKLVFVNTNAPDITLSLICTLYDMKSREVIKKFHHTGVIYYFQ